MNEIMIGGIACGVAIGIILGFHLTGATAEFKARRLERDAVQRAKIREWDNSERGRNIRAWQREQELKK